VILYFKKTKKSELSFFKKTKGKKRKGSLVNYQSFAITSTVEWIMQLSRETSRPIMGGLQFNIL
jgi:hypothetical protein